MTAEPLLRAAEAADLPDLEALYAATFRDEDLRPLVRALVPLPAVLSLVVLAGPDLVGHVAFTRCRIAGRPEVVALLGPLAVAPSRQGEGIGGALVREGLRRLAAEGVVRVQVLGDPGYYGRFGFAADDAVAPPYPLPEAWRAAWQSLDLRAGSPALSGRLDVPGPWRQPALWAP